MKLSTIEFDQRYLGEEVIFETDFSSAEVEAFPANLQAVSGNMLVREYEGRKSLLCFGTYKFAIDLPKNLGNAYSIEVEAVENSRKAHYPYITILVYPGSSRDDGDGGLVVLDVQGVSLEKKHFVFEPRPGLVARHTADENRQLLAAGVALDGELVRAFCGFRQTLIVPQRYLTRLAYPRQLLFSGSHAAKTSIVIRHIRVAKLSSRQLGLLEQKKRDCSDAEPADGDQERRVIFQESLDNVCAGSVPIRADIEQQAGCGAHVVNFLNRHWMAGNNELEISLPDTLPSKFVVEFTAFIFAKQNSPHAISLTLSQSRALMEQLSIQASAKVRGRGNAVRPRIGSPGGTGVILGTNPGQSKLIAVPGGESNQETPIGTPFECRLVGDGSNLKMFLDGKLAATATNGLSFAPNILHLSTVSGSKALVVWTDLKVY